MTTSALKTTLLVSLLVAGAVITSANAEILQVYADPYARDVDRQMQDWIGRVRDQGFGRIIIDDRGVIYPDGTPASFRLRLQRGVEYRFAARCDSDCYDLDLVLEDPGGREVIADRDRDVTPGFRYLPSWSGEYTLKLELADGSGLRTQVGAAVASR